jgi:hypothetical protein
MAAAICNARLSPHRESGHFLWPQPGLAYSSRMRRAYSSRISSAILARDKRTSSANGAFGWRERHASYRPVFYVLRVYGEKTTWPTGPRAGPGDGRAPAA